MLVVSGHVHEDYGIAKRNGSVLLNPSNFGGVDSIEGYQAGGTYAEVYIENRKVERVRLMLLREEQSIPLMDIRVEENSLRGTILPGAADVSPLNLSMFLRDTSGRPVEL